MRLVAPFLWLLIAIVPGFSQTSSTMKNDDTLKIPFEEHPNYSSTYLETINFYRQLDEKYTQLELLSYGSTDSGFPLNLAVLSMDGDFDPKSLRDKGKYILMINNAIHPGESCGVEASMLLLREYLENKALHKYLENLVIIVIPMYNIGGALNRNSTTRTNQNGPEAYGFRGNARNLDLNRDFIKCDSRNAQTFNEIFTLWQPDVFIDNHTSNGADYQYTITLIPTQEDKVDPNIATYMRARLLPALFEDMKTRNWEMTPYVYARNTPDEGIAAFLDLPRFSSGYAALFNTISFMPETHMLKPFKDRVASTKAFSESIIKAIYEDGAALKIARQKAIAATMEKSTFELNWELDFSRQDKWSFKGYEAKYKPSEVSGLDRLYYDREAPYEKEIPWFRYYKPSLSIEKPVAYIIPQAYGSIIEKMQSNGVKMERLKAETELEVEMYRIIDFETRDAYEGHYLHTKVQVEKELKKWTYHRGDYIIPTDQAANRYIMETLEPQAPDSWFAWNFFDGILQQKEYFSDYVFEDLAADYLKQHPELKQQLDEKKAADEDFARSADKQLEFIYMNSPWHEPTYRLYPVGRIMEIKKQ
ncbi:MAG: M14 family metallopeptidase [Saprospiraceae bacterium]|nr:M14 family metallopeptidase [Saprospiraceae bacterium]